MVKCTIVKFSTPVQNCIATKHPPTTLETLLKKPGNYLLVDKAQKATMWDPLCLR